MSKSRLYIPNLNPALEEKITDQLHDELNKRITLAKNIMAASEEKEERQLYADKIGAYQECLENVWQYNKMRIQLKEIFDELAPPPTLFPMPIKREKLISELQIRQLIASGKLNNLLKELLQIAIEMQKIRKMEIDFDYAKSIMCFFDECTYQVNADLFLDQFKRVIQKIIEFDIADNYEITLTMIINNSEDFTTIEPKQRCNFKRHYQIYTGREAYFFSLLGLCLDALKEFNAQIASVPTNLFWQDTAKLPVSDKKASFDLHPVTFHYG